MSTSSLVYPRTTYLKINRNKMIPKCIYYTSKMDHIPRTIWTYSHSWVDSELTSFWIRCWEQKLGEIWYIVQWWTTVCFICSNIILGQIVGGIILDQFTFTSTGIQILNVQPRTGTCTCTCNYMCIKYSTCTCTWDLKVVSKIPITGTSIKERVLESTETW